MYKKYNLMFRRSLSLIAISVTLSSCGGGGGGGGAVTPITFPASSTLVNLCANPRTGTNPFNGNPLYPDQQGTLANEKSWLRSWTDETYLWYQEVPNDLNPDNYPTAIDYFYVLKTPAKTAANRPKDKFRFTYPTAIWEAMSQQGVELGYGIQFVALNSSSITPRRWVVAYVEPNSPAETAGILRGDELSFVDGVDFRNANDPSSINTLNAGLNPTIAGQTHQFIFRRNGSNLPVSSLVASNVTTTPVQNVTTITTATGVVGYLTFNSHNEVSEAQLIDAITQLQAAGVSDLVLDLRYNGGGFLSIASELAYMIAGPQMTSDKIFARTRHNNKIPDIDYPFYINSLGLSAPSNTPLPFLGLQEVTILTGPGTCSASELIINGLRGVDVKVNLIGETTCGKPYGFYPTPNCGTTYFAIQIQVVNQKNFGDYADGFAPICSVSDDFTRPLGDPLEGQLSAALNYRASGICADPNAVSAGLKAGGVADSVQLIRSRLKEITIFKKPL